MTTRSNSPYIPSFIKSAVQDARPVQQTYADAALSDTNHKGSGSYKYDPLGSPLKSTQQLNVDWSKFENHTFFSSAEVKVNEAFNNIINGFPFDGTKKEVETFLDGLTGFEKWVFDRFPKFAGALHFSGTQVNEDPANGYPEKLGTWIATKDKAGVLFPEISKNPSGEVVINPPGDSSFSIEAQIFIPPIANDTQVIFQKSSSDVDGFMLHLEPSTSTTSASAVFSVSSGADRNTVSSVLRKGAYNHVCVVINKEPEDTREDVLQFFLNESNPVTSKYNIGLGRLDIDSADFLIGTGSSFYSRDALVTPLQTFSGTIDELRVFHSARDAGKQSLYASKGLYSTPELKLYYRFNEPPPPLATQTTDAINTIVLDSSGNSLHAFVNNFTGSLRIDVSQDQLSPVTNEKPDFRVILFPAHPDIMSLNASLLAEARNYDLHNPNIITKLVPQHYLLEGASLDGFATIEGQGGDPYGGTGIPGQGKQGSVQIILSFLYIWSKFFDEIKLYIDAFGTLKTVSYDTDDTIPDNFLDDLVKRYGFYLPKFFSHATVEQFAEGENVDGLTNTDTPLKQIQAVIMRRVLVNMPDIVRSKGTQHSIRSFLRSVGIDPDNSLKIREYGGPTTKQLTSSRNKRLEPGAMVNFISSSVSGVIVISPFLSASRVEPGFPPISGTFYTDPLTGRNLGTTAESDGLLTSGSWTIEGLFKIPPKNIETIGIIPNASGSQSLFRLAVFPDSFGLPLSVANVVATQATDYPKRPATLLAYLRPGTSVTSSLLTLSMDMEGKGIFDGDKWNVSLGCMRNDEFDAVSSSYYLRAGKSDGDGIEVSYMTSSFLATSMPGEDNILQKMNTYVYPFGLTNISGSFIIISNAFPVLFAPGLPFLLDNTLPSAASTLDFSGLVSNLRFWSKSMSTDEWKEHVRNPTSTGVEDPAKNYNFVTNVSGSFQKLRLDTLRKQPIRSTNGSSLIQFLDFSQNSLSSIMPAAGKGNTIGFFQDQPDTRVLVGDLFNYSFLSHAFDESSTDDKIRIRSFDDPDLLAENPWASPTPSYLNESSFIQEEPQDDTRLSIEFSLIDSLDKDIVTMFSSLETLGDALGKPELMFSPDYPDLEILQDVYFNRLSSKLDFRKFLEFYRWFDISISSFVEQLLSTKTRYKGTNFVIESHMLERHKNMYRHSQNYLGDKIVIDDTLLVQQIVGQIRKY